VSSPEGSIEAVAYPHPGAPTDVVSIPMGQGHAAGGRYAEGRGSNVLSILSPLKDSDTSALAWAATRVRIEKTGRSTSLPTFENSAPDLAVDEDQIIIPLTQQDT
jgi:anaerobic selenocysteine-containing dehydrogenase